MAYQNQVSKNIEHYTYLFNCTGLKTLVVAVGSRWVALTLNARQSRKSEPVCPVGHVQKGVQTSTAGGKSNLDFHLVKGRNTPDVRFRSALKRVPQLEHLLVVTVRKTR